MIIGIDATNIKSDGGIVHLFELINNFNFKKTNIKKIIIWGNSKSLKQIKKNSKINKIQIDKVSSSSFYIIFWQLFFLPNQLKKNNCDILYVLAPTISFNTSDPDIVLPDCLTLNSFSLETETLTLSSLFQYLLNTSDLFI